MYQQNTSPKGCYYENKDHSVIFMECDTADCYYKQLKRLQQENEQLKEKLIGIDKNGKYYYVEENNNYKQALEEIREICKKETSHYDRLIEIVTKVGEVLK
jgi:guanylate kinase